MRIKLASVSVLAVLLASASCGDGTSTTNALPTAPGARRDAAPTAGPVPGACVTPNGLAVDVSVLTMPVSARTTVNGNIGRMISAIGTGDIATAQSLSLSTTKFLIALYKAGSITGTRAQVAKLLNDLLCDAGLATTITDPGNSDVIYPTDGPRTVITTDGTGGVSFPAGAVSEPTIITLALLPNIYGPGHGPLDTKLDQYAGYLDVSKWSPTGAPLALPVVVAVCPPSDMDPIVRARLRLGHQATSGFEITPAADASFLSCSPGFGAAPGRVERWLNALASLVLPRPAYARATKFESGGVGGTAGEFSPFDAVDPNVSFSGGVGGTAGEFQITPRRRNPLSGNDGQPAASGAGSISVPSGPSFTVVAGVCTDTAALPGTVLETQCSPAISMTTHLGTKLTGVPVSWAITAGGGTVAPVGATPGSCGTFGATASLATDVDGESHVCWTMGPTPGHRNNTLVATPSTGGDAPLGVTFVPGSGTFKASSLARTPTATATGLTTPFDNAPHAGSGSCSDGLIPVLSYSAAGAPIPGAPTNAGSYTLTVTCGDGGVFFVTVSRTAAIVITPAATTTAISCPASVWFTGSPLTPCTASVTGPALSLTPTPAYSSNTAIGTATASYSYPGGTNWAPSSGSTTFQISAGFTDGFEVESGWSTTGLWHRSTLRRRDGTPITNALYPSYVNAGGNDAYLSHGRMPAPSSGAWTFWYGSEATGNYIGTQIEGDPLHSGGTSVAPNSGDLTSPTIVLPTTPAGRALILRFNAWWEIEGLHPSSRDKMQVSVYDAVTGLTTLIGTLNPVADPSFSQATLPFTSGGGYAGIPAWIEVKKNLDAFSGHPIRLVFSFDTRDTSINGFRGLLIDNVRVATEATP